MCMRVFYVVAQHVNTVPLGLRMRFYLISWFDDGEGGCGWHRTVLEGGPCAIILQPVIPSFYTCGTETRIIDTEMSNIHRLTVLQCVYLYKHS